MNNTSKEQISGAEQSFLNWAKEAGVGPEAFDTAIEIWNEGDRPFIHTNEFEPGYEYPGRPHFRSYKGEGNDPDTLWTFDEEHSWTGPDNDGHGYTLDNALVDSGMAELAHAVSYAEDDSTSNFDKNMKSWLTKKDFGDDVYGYTKFNRGDFDKDPSVMFPASVMHYADSAAIVDHDTGPLNLRWSKKEFVEYNPETGKSFPTSYTRRDDFTGEAEETIYEVHDIPEEAYAHQVVEHSLNRRMEAAVDRDLRKAMNIIDIIGGFKGMWETASHPSNKE